MELLSARIVIRVYKPVKYIIRKSSQFRYEVFQIAVPVVVRFES